MEEDEIRADQAPNMVSRSGSARAKTHRGLREGRSETQNGKSRSSCLRAPHHQGPNLAEDTVEEWDPKAKKWRISQTILNWKRADSRAVIVPAAWYPTC